MYIIFSSDAMMLLLCAKTRSNRSFTTMRTLLSDGCSCNFQDNVGRTALHYACQRGAGVDMLLRAGIVLLFIAVFTVILGPVALSVLMMTWSLNMILFTVLGADPNIQDSYGNVPLLIASTEGFDEVVISLIEKGSNPDVKNQTGKSALHFLAMKNHHRGKNYH